MNMIQVLFDIKPEFRNKFDFKHGKNEFLICIVARN